MSTRTKLVIFAIVAISFILVTATSSSVLATTPSRGKSINSGTTSNPNSLSKKELKTFIDCVTAANKQPTGLSNKIARNCYDKAKGIALPTTGATAGATAGAAAGARAVITPQTSKR